MSILGQVGHGLTEGDHARTLAFQHWIEAVSFCYYYLVSLYLVRRADNKDVLILYWFYQIHTSLD